MRRLVLTVAAIAALGVLGACATATPYQAAPAGAHTGAFGYTNYKIDSAHWRVGFSGNSMTSRETVEKYLLYRAAELTIEQGADWFETTDRQTERKTSYYADPDPFYHSAFWASCPWGWRTWDPWFGGPFWAGSVDVQQVDRYEATTEIVMGRNPPPDGHRVFNAKEVVANLGPAIQRPQS